ncbi:MAG: fibronectin type III domain-containing protein, partial [Aquihabitans sp.]
MNGKWVERARGTLTSTSTYRITLKPSERATYTLRVRRLATGTDLEASTSRLTLVTATPPDAPPAPTASVSGSSAQVSWAAPNSNGSPIDHYLLLLDGGAQQTCATTTCTLNGLTAGTTH